MSSQDIRNNRIFGVLLLLSEVVLIFMFGFFITYTSTRIIGDDYYIIAVLFILAICGFGLITTYIKSVSTASLTHVIIILGLSIQLYFPFRGFWEIIGLSGTPWSTRNGSNQLPISVTNIFNDRYVSQMLQSSPLTDYIACFISLIVAYSAIIGRVGNLQVYFFTVIGTFIYQFNWMIFWRIYVADIGYGMRIFLFGGCFGLFASLILGKRNLTITHKNFKSQYIFQTFNLFGSIIIWCLLPVLIWSNLWHSSTIGLSSFILHISSLNMWFSLFGSAIGAFCGSIMAYTKLSVHTIIFSVFTGGIAFTSCSNLTLNIGAALAVGFLTGLVCSASTSMAKQWFNKKGIRDSNGVFSSYLIPGAIAGILSAVFQANGYPQDYTGSYRGDWDLSNRSPYGQGGIQIAGFGIALGLGIFAGVISGFLMKIFNSNRQSVQQQFSQQAIVTQLKPIPVQQTKIQ